MLIVLVLVFCVGLWMIYMTHTRRRNRRVTRRRREMDEIFNGEDFPF